MGFDIAYIVSHGFAARMVTQTDLLGKLVKAGKKVALIAPDAKDENLTRYCQSSDVELFEFNVDSKFWSSQYQDARKYFLEDIRANPALWEKHIYATKYNKSKNPWSHVRPRLLLLVHKLVKQMPQLRSWYLKRERRHLRSARAVALLDKIDPKVVVATYPVDFREAMLLLAAKDSGRKTVIHLLSWDNITCKGRFPVLADEYIAWGPTMKAELMQYYGVERDSIRTCGVPHFDLHLRALKSPRTKRYLQILGLDPEAPYLLFAMSSPRFAPREIDIVEWLTAGVEQDMYGSSMQLVIRPHPQNVCGNMADESWLPRLRSLVSGRIAVDIPLFSASKMLWSMQKEDMIRLSHLLVGCSLNLNSGSTISIEALICNKPVVLTSFDGSADLGFWRSARRLVEYFHLKKLVDMKGVSVATSYLELELQIGEYLKDGTLNQEDRNMTLRKQVESFNSGATAAAVQSLIRMHPHNEGS